MSKSLILMLELAKNSLSNPISEKKKKKNEYIVGLKLLIKPLSEINHQVFCLAFSFVLENNYS